MAARGNKEPSRVWEGGVIGHCGVNDPITADSIHPGTKGIFIEVWVRIRHLARAAA